MRLRRRNGSARTLDDVAALVDDLRMVSRRLTGWTTIGTECPSPARMLSRAADEIERILEGKYDEEIRALAASPETDEA